MKKILITLLLLFVTLPVLAKNTILIVGDSISAGYGLDPKQGWVALLQKKLQDEHFDYIIVNASISGDTTSNGLNRLPDALSLHHPSITIIELGANDGLRGLTPLQIKMNLQKMITLAKDSGSKVLLLGLRLPPNYGEAYIKQFQQVYLDVTKNNTVYFVPLFLNNVDDKPDLMQADNIHPNEQAQAILLNNMWPELRKLLK